MHKLGVTPRSQEHLQLASLFWKPHVSLEVALRKSLKMKTLGPWPIFARQDNCQAKISVAFPGRRRCQHQVLSYASLCHRKRKSQIDSINVQGNEVVTHDLMADAHYMITTIA